MRRSNPPEHFPDVVGQEFVEGAGAAVISASMAPCATTDPGSLEARRELTLGAGRTVYGSIGHSGQQGPSGIKGSRFTKSPPIWMSGNPSEHPYLGHSCTLPNASLLLEASSSSNAMWTPAWSSVGISERRSTVVKVSGERPQVSGLAPTAGQSPLFGRGLAREDAHRPGLT